MVVLRLLLQHRVETVENGHPAREEVVIIRRGLDETVDRQVHARGFVAGELAVVQIRLVHDLGDQLDAPVLDAEPLDERLECTVLAVMAEVSAPRTSNGIPWREASAASANANFASGSQKRLMSQAEAMRSMCGRGRVTQVLPRAGSDVRWRPPGARGGASAARRRLAVVSHKVRARSPAGAFR